MIEVQGLRKTYGVHEVLKGIDLRITRSTITGVAGPNGCGKTTLMKCILGLTIPSGGQILFDGSPADVGGSFRRHIGYMPQAPDFPANLSLRELLKMLEDLRKMPAVCKDELISYFGLEPVLTQPFGQLSGGTKQKLSAVVALMFDAPLLLLDEPTAGLDPMARVHFKDLIARKAQEGKTVILVSHFMSEIEDLASRLVFLNDGQVIYSGGIAEIKDNGKEQNLERCLTRYFLKYRGAVHGS